VGWVCGVCGTFHDEAMRDIRLSLPDPVFALDDEARERRVEMSDDFCILSDSPESLRFFVRGLIHLPIRRDGNGLGSEDFRYGVWVEVDPEGYRRLGERWRDERGHETAPVFGRLANELSSYPGTDGLGAALQLREVSILPAVVLTDGSHPLAEHQRRGIDEAQANRLAEAVLHES
jgi:hypothetical protein